MIVKRKAENISVESAIEMFLIEKRAQGVKEETLQGYKKDLLDFFKYTGDLSTINGLDFSMQINTLLQIKKPVTVNHYIRTYRAFLYWCMKNEYVKEFKINLVKAQDAPIRIYSIEDIEKLLVKPTKKDAFHTWRTWAMVSFVMATGARSVNLKTQEVIYRHSKNKHAPIVPICDELKTCLLVYMKEFELTDYLFPNQDNTQMTDHGISQALRKYCRLRNVEYKSFHALRHTYAKQFILNGGNPFQLQKMLDHQTLAMSQHYTHLFGSDLHGVVNDFSPLSKMRKK